jgi:competence protein ComEC
LWCIYVNVNDTHMENETVNVNKASELELQYIIHVGPVRAKKIVDRRPYRDLFELSNVLGLGKSRILDIWRQNIVVV